jgi:hypothetical protein
MAKLFGFEQSQQTMDCYGRPTWLASSLVPAIFEPFGQVGVLARRLFVPFAVPQGCSAPRSFPLPMKHEQSIRNIFVWVRAHLGKYLISLSMFSHAEGTLGKKAHDVGQVSGNSLVKYREWMGVNLVVRKV